MTLKKQSEQGDWNPLTPSLCLRHLHADTQHTSGLHLIAVPTAEVSALPMPGNECQSNLQSY